MKPILLTLAVWLIVLCSSVVIGSATRQLPVPEHFSHWSELVDDALEASVAAVFFAHQAAWHYRKKQEVEELRAKLSGKTDGRAD